MVERFYSQLKAAIKCHQTEAWVDILPVVLLGIRASWKEDLQATSAELVFGESTRLPGQFLVETQSPETQTNSWLEQLQRSMRELQPRIRRHGHQAPFVFKDLETAIHVFVRRSILSGALQSPYNGSFKITSRNSKIFKVLIHGKEVTVSADRVKPAYLFEETNTEPQTTLTKETELPTRTRSGRISKPTVRFAPAS
ncbi:uncharacterized protein LOC109862804 [Pseudomyrmex gracilis]|uniref:uncharacterized protein LOC109862804 n=1 Tax=Pseudomyrmex gracilis TaxID=219809 RepID=UPI0009951793|nr:uncharacterized protein LOC109862804 [Pseudomyrmex gracilis]